MNAETLDAFVAADPITFKKLLTREAVFCLFRMTDNHITFFQWAGVITETNQVRQAGAFFQIVNVTDVVQINDGV